MIRILVIGGYGGFGSHLSRRLARSEFEVLVAGRNPARAAAFCRDDPSCRPVRADRDEGIAAVLAAERPAIVVDASGPFQTAGSAVIEDCIAAGVHYLDLADAREFVCGIGRYDRDAREAGVVVVSGASSVPALSGAVVRKLAEGINRVTSVGMAISASSKASAGASVAAAILGGVGQPIELWRGQRWTKGHGWQELGSERIEAGQGRPLGSRMVALADVPDLFLLPDRLPGRPAVTFRAGTESALAVLALWLASWPVRWNWVRSLAPMARFLLSAHRVTKLWGGNRSGMTVRLFGLAGERRIERRWSLVANAGDGPQIPTLAAALLVDRVSKGLVPAGARDAGDLLELDGFEPLFATLAVEHSITEIEHPPALYRRVMGASFSQLPPAVQAMHDVLRDSGAKGRATVERGPNRLGRIIAGLMRFPAAGEHPVHVHFTEKNGKERWTRTFGPHRFASTLSQAGGEMAERFGPFRFHFALTADQQMLSMSIKRWSFMGLSLPLALAPRSPAREWEEGGLFHFDVPIELPGIGLIVRYRGWLEPPSGPAAH